MSSKILRGSPDNAPRRCEFFSASGICALKTIMSSKHRLNFGQSLKRPEKDGGSIGLNLNFFSSSSSPRRCWTFASNSSFIFSASVSMSSALVTSSAFSDKVTFINASWQSSHVLLQFLRTEVIRGTLRAVVLSRDLSFSNVLTKSFTLAMNFLVSSVGWSMACRAASSNEDVGLVSSSSFCSKSLKILLTVSRSAAPSASIFGRKGSSL